MRKKQLVINLFSNIVAFSVSLFISFIITPYLISTVGKEAYGFYPIANNFVSYLMIISLALNSVASRFITIEMVKHNVLKAKTYYSSIFFANILLAMILLVPMVGILVFLDVFLNIPSNLMTEVSILFTLVFVSMLINLISSVFGVATFVKNRLDLRSGGEIIQGLLKMILYIFLYSQFNASIIFIGIVALLLSIINLIIQLLFTKKLLPDFHISIRRFDINSVKVLLTSGVWNSINSLGSILLLSVSLLLANVFIGASASGELSIVQILPQFISGIIIMLFSVFMPRITQVFANGDYNAIVNEIVFSQKVIGLLSSTPIILIIIFGHEFFSLWVPSENAIKLHWLSIITIIPLIIHANMWTVYGSNIVLNKVKLPSLILIGLGLVNVIVCYILLAFFVTSIYVIPIVSGVINVLYYLCIIPTYAAIQLKVSKFTFQKHLIKVMAFAIIFSLLGNIAKETISITNWGGLFLVGAAFGVIGFLFNSLFTLSRSDFCEIYTLISRLKSDRRKNMNG